MWRQVTYVEYDLDGKVALITGGNGGIGAATGRELLRRGARVVVADLDPETPERSAAIDPDRMLGCVVDVRDKSSLDHVVAEAVDRFGRLDVVVANAGLLAEAATLRNTSAAAVAATLAVNVMGVVNTVTAGLEEVIRNRGQVVLISSVYAFINGMGNIPYAMSKAAVEQLGRALRVELADHGASVLTAYFSFVDTNMIHQRVDKDDVLIELLDTLPKSLISRISPSSAATVVADALRDRSSSVVHPARWRALSGLRGLIGPPMDAYLASNRRTLDLIARLDVRAHSRTDSNGS